ncbi:MAG TPA: sodium:solute symporter family protein [Candidatus Acidoferrales bacterium]|nr:sodium:solute symporter family protein [Candidatus Acidoferrales bacterium]
MNIYLLTLIGYSFLLIAVGLFAARKVKNASDFLVAGRRFGPGVIFATFLAANIGAGSTVGASGLGYRFGLSAWWWVGSAGLGTIVLSQLIGPRLWRMAKAHGMHTMGDYLELRYNKSVRGVIAAILWFGTLAILAGQLMAISWILNVVAGLPKWVGCLAGGIVAITYCTAGGLASSAIVNILELAVTMPGLVVSALYSLHALGGWSGLDAALVRQMGASAPHWTTFTGAGSKQIFAYVSILVPSFICSPGLAQKLYGARDAKAVRWGVGLNSIGQLCFAVVPAIFGMVALAHFAHLGNPELALPTVLVKLVPPWLGLWSLASIFSAELSATDAILFMLSTSLAVDLYKAFIYPDVPQKRLLAVSRLTTVVAGLAGIGLSIALPSVISAVSIFYGLLAVALFIPFVLGLYWSRMSTPAALASIFTAILADLIVQYGTPSHGIGLLSPASVGILVGLVAAIVVSLAAPHVRVLPAKATMDERA